MDKLNGQSMDLENKNIEELKKLFPNAVTEGKIDFEKLKLMLGEEIDDSIEKYQFTWNGKSKAIKLAQMPSTSTLRPSVKDSKDWDTTENLFIEGDNLEVLKQLQKTYFGKIKMIYIDPPYNTGGDFVYKDDFKDSLKNYKEQTNQSKSSNAETSGRYHTDWLNMMYPRLTLAKNLLKDDGAIFISIDDSEMNNLKKICDEIFGEDNFLATIIWERAFSPVNTKKHFSSNHDYILCFAKNIDLLESNGLVRNDDTNSRYTNPDNDARGPWTSGDLSVGPVVESKLYEIITPSGRKVYPPSGYCWRVSKDKLQQMIDDNRIWFGEDGDNVPRIKRFLSEVKTGITPMTVWRYKDVGHSQNAKQNLKKLFNDVSVFDYPKSIELLKRSINLYTERDSIVLDFFSGSATTAHAVMKLNAEDYGKRKFIMVQLPEQTEEKSEAYKAGYKNICEIGKERIRRAGEQIKQELIEKKEKAGMLDENIVDPDSLDVGFKVFKLDKTNIKAWDSSADVTKETLLDQVEVIKENRTKADVLYEVLLKYGVFNQPVKESIINNKTMYDIGEGYMIVNLNDKIEDTDIKAITKQSPHVVIFLESGFINDNDKINAEATLKHNGVEDVKCI
jgi:adenine-specific DNA-methyltransferase